MPTRIIPFPPHSVPHSSLSASKCRVGEQEISSDPMFGERALEYPAAYKDPGRVIPTSICNPRTSLGSLKSFF